MALRPHACAAYSAQAESEGCEAREGPLARASEALLELPGVLELVARSGAGRLLEHLPLPQRSDCRWLRSLSEICASQCRLHSARRRRLRQRGALPFGPEGEERHPSGPELASERSQTDPGSTPARPRSVPGASPERPTERDRPRHARAWASGSTPGASAIGAAGSIPDRQFGRTRIDPRIDPESAPCRCLPLPHVRVRASVRGRGSGGEALVEVLSVRRARGAIAQLCDLGSRRM